MQLRHRLVPYIYTINAQAATPQTNLTLVQPLYWNFPSREIAYQFPYEFFFGSSLIVAPIVRPRDKRTNLAKTRVWVAPRRHVDIFTGYVFDGDREINMYRDLQHIPVLAAEGSIIPLDRESVPANGCANPNAFEVFIVVGHDGQFNILENTRDDQGSQASTETVRSIPIEYDQAAGRVTAVAAGKEWTFRFISFSTVSDIRVLVDGSVATEAECSVETEKHHLSVVVKVPAAKNLDSVITIELGPNPQLDIIDHTKP